MSVRLPSSLKCVTWVVLSAAVAAFAGPLTPPPGAVQSTNRTTINQQAIVALPYTISTPGSYVLISNLTGTAGQNGIEISTNDVSIDLNGFALIGVPGALAAIHVSDPGGGDMRKNISISNGSLTDWDTAGIDIGYASNSQVRDIRAYRSGSGILANYCTTVENCVAEGNFLLGISVGNVSSVSRCTAVFNGGGGIVAGDTATVSHCAAETNQGAGIRVGNGCAVSFCVMRNNFIGKGSAPGVFANDGCTITGCSADINTGNGYDIGSRCTIAGSTASGNSGAGVYGFDDITVSNSTCSGNGWIGIYINGGAVANCTTNRNGGGGIYSFLDRMAITNCTATNNFSTGIYVDGTSVISNCTANNNLLSGIEAAAGAEGTRIANCVAAENAFDGINVVDQCSVVSCNAARNNNNGIVAAAGCRIESNHCDSNGALGGGTGPGAGIRVTGDRNRIDNNSVTKNDFGVQATSTRSTIIRNSARGNTDNYGGIVAGNDVGPIGTAAASTSPWANIAY